MSPIAAEPGLLKGAERWIQSLPADVYDEALTQLGSLPAEYRRALIARATPAERARAYRSLLEDFRAAYPAGFALTTEREQVLNELHAFLTPSLFRGEAITAAEDAQLKSLVDRALRQFDRGNVAVLTGAFCTAPPDGTALPLRERWARYARQNLGNRLVSAATLQWLVTTVEAQQPTQCECSQISDWCSGKSDCGMPTQGCISSDWGCGTYGLYVCDGSCLDVIITE